MLAIGPVVFTLLLLGIVEKLSQQRVLFASLASNAFLIYLHPHHVTNSIRTLVIAQISAAIFGSLAFAIFGSTSLAIGAAMIAVTVLMIVCDAVHPPAVSTALGFAFHGAAESQLELFGVGVFALCGLIVLQRVSVWMLGRFSKRIGKTI